MNLFFAPRQDGLSVNDFLLADDKIDLSKMPKDFTIYSISDLNNAKKGDLSFFVISLVSGDKYKKSLASTEASFIIVKRQYENLVKSPAIPIISDEPYITFTRLCKMLLIEKKSFDENIIDQTATISPLASIGKYGVKIGKNVLIEDFVKISDGVEIGDNTIVKSGVKIGNNCKIGTNCVLRENCVIQYTLIGNDCCIHSNASLGQDGFGYSFDKRTGKNEKINHFGIVRIGNNVEIGSNTCIDRSVFGETIIEDHVKMDNLVQIAHNAKIGCGTVMAGQSAVAGGGIVGKYCMLGGKSALAGHISIGNQCIVYADAKVTKSFPDHSKVIGTPADLYHVYVRKYAILQTILGKKIAKAGVKGKQSSNSFVQTFIKNIFKNS